jgi:hypothetical protein
MILPFQNIIFPSHQEIILNMYYIIFSIYKSINQHVRIIILWECIVQLEIKYFKILSVYAFVEEYLSQ